MAAAPPPPPPPTTSQPPSPPPPPPPRRIVICGGGVIGSCTAYFLSNHNTTAAASIAITIVEKSSVACAASGKAGGFLALDWSDGTSLSSLSRASFTLHRTLSQRLNGPTNYGYRPLRTLSLSVSPSLPNPNPNPSLPSWIDGPVGAKKTIGTLDTTAQLHPKLFTQTLIQNSPGVDVLTGEIKKVQVDDDDGEKVVGVVVSVDREERFVPADAVVLALGPWSSRLPFVSSLFSVSGLKAHSIVIRPADPDSITPHALFLSYKDSLTPGAKALDPEVYPRPTGEVYVCGMSREEEVPDDPEAIVGDPESIEMLHRIAGTVSSGLRRGGDGGGAEVVAEQACFLPCTEDGLPVIGEMPGVKGCFVATGHSCWGILNGPATGASLAELILEGRSSTVDLTSFSPSRFLRRVRLGRK